MTPGLTMNNASKDTDTTSGAKGGSFGFGTVVRGIRRYPFLTVATIAAAAAVRAGGWFLLPLPKMTAYVTYQIASKPLFVLAPAGDGQTDFNFYRQAQVTQVVSRPVLNAALDQPGMKDVQLLRQQSDKIGWLESKLKVDSRA